MTSYITLSYHSKLCAGFLVLYPSNEGEFMLFADDTNKFFRGQTALLAFTTANEILRKVND